MPGFWRGLSCPFRGLAFLAGRRELWKYAGAAYALNLVLFAAAGVALWSFWPDLIRALTPEKTPSWLLPALSCLLMLVAALLALFLFTIVGNLVAGPFLDAMTERMLAGLGETLPPSRGIASALARTLVNQLVKLILFGGIQALLLILLVTPAGFLHPPLAALLTVLFLALEYADYALDARRVPVPSRLAWVFRHARPALGFGLSCLALSLVPFLLYLFLPSTVCGAALLVRACAAEAATASRRRDIDPGDSKA
jgi:CysZ protein